MSSPEIAVVLPVHREREAFDRQLSALADQEGVDHWELVVAASDPLSPARRYIERRQAALPQTTVVDASGRNRPAGRNLAVRHTNSPLLAFCDADDLVTPTWLAHLKDALTDHDLVAARVVTVSDEAPPMPPPEPIRRAWRHGFLPFADTAGMGVTRTAYDSVGGFDESFVRGSDVDFSWRVQQAGFRFGTADEAVVYKYPRTTLRGTWAQWYGWGRADVQLFVRFRDRGMPRHAISAAGRSLAASGRDLVRSPSRASVEQMLRLTARHCGRAVASVEHRALYP